MRRWISGVVAGAALMTSALVSGQASASLQYPGTLMQNYFPDSNLNPTQLCTYCHATLAGGASTVVMPFGMRMLREGLTGGGDVARLTMIVDRLVADAAAGNDVDSDGDSFDDILELMQGSDPSDPTIFLQDAGGGNFTVVGREPIPDLTFGCGAHVSRSTDTGLWGTLGLVALGLLGVRRRRRTHG